MLTARSPTSVYPALSLGVVAVSFAAIFIRLADAPPLAIAAYRMGISAAVMTAVAGGAWWRGGLRNAPGLTRRDLPLLGFSSICLALHFWLWIVSLDYTSVASSVVLVTTNPFIIAVASRILWGEPLWRHTVVGIAIGVAGGLAIALGDAGGEGELFGDLLACLGAIAIVGYMLVGRRLRAYMPAMTYNTVVYTGAALCLVIGAIVAGEPFAGFTTGTYVMLVLVALIPQVVGHSLLNWSLAHVTATAVAISVMAEPVIATVAAVPILREIPPLTSVVGGLLILAGIYIAIRSRNTGQRITGPAR